MNDRHHGHVWVQHDGTCPYKIRNRTCPACDHGLLVCSVCTGVEGALPPVCPGYELDAPALERAYLEHKRRASADAKRAILVEQARAFGREMQRNDYAALGTAITQFADQLAVVLPLVHPADLDRVAEGWEHVSALLFDAAAPPAAGERDLDLIDGTAFIKYYP